MVAVLLALTLVPPVPGPVAREFSFAAEDAFRAGRHRGADFAAAPGTRARAACAGRVVWAGHGVVTVRCGRWRVTHLPLATMRVRAGSRVLAGTPLGTVGRARGHAGLHLGVRRAGDAFGYVDPVPLLASERRPPVAGRRGPRVGAPPRRDAPRPRLPATRRTAGVRVPSAGLAPWPAWLGLAVLLLGAAGGGVRISVRARRASRAAARAKALA